MEHGRSANQTLLVGRPGATVNGRVQETWKCHGRLVDLTKSAPTTQFGTLLTLFYLLENHTRSYILSLILSSPKDEIDDEYVIAFELPRIPIWKFQTS